MSGNSGQGAEAALEGSPTIDDELANGATGETVATVYRGAVLGSFVDGSVGVSVRWVRCQ